MYTKIPKEWRHFEGNVTLEQLNDLLVRLHIPTIVFIIALMVVGFLGNLVVLYIYSRKYHASTHRSFILWLAWIDLIACCVGKPSLIVSMLYPYMLPSEAGCKTLRLLHVFVVVSSAFIVVTVALERHRRICSPFSREMSIRKINLMCLVAAILGFLVAVPATLVFGKAEVATGVQNITGHECYIDPKWKETSFPKLYFLFQLTLCVVSMVFLSIFYFRIGRKIFHHHRFIRENACSPTPTSPSIRAKPFSFNVKTTPSARQFAYRDDSKRKTCAAISRYDSTRADRSRETTPIRGINPKKDWFSNIKNKAVQTTDDSPSSSSVAHSTEVSGTSRTRLEPLRIRKQPTIKAEQGLRTKQVTIMLFIITVVFVLSFIPHLALMVMISMNPEFLDDMSPTVVSVYNLFLRFFVINNMANPIIYGFCDPKFRSECADLAKTVITCGRY